MRVLLLLICFGSSLIGQGLEPLPIVLPKPMFEGTPVDTRIPNLEKPLDLPRPPFLAPAGTINVARGKPVVSSVMNPILGRLDQITDGQKEGYDSHCVEMQVGVQHVTVDLRARHVIYAILLWHYHQQPRIYFDVVVQVADDPDFIADVRTVFNNDHDNTSGLGIGKDKNYVETAEGKLLDARGIEGRYVRLYSHGSNASPVNNYVEVEVYGKPTR